MKMKFKAWHVIIFTCCIFFTKNKASAQRQHTANYNAWLVYNGTHKFSNKFGLHAEVQWRRANVVSEPQQLLLRTGINYHINNQVYFTLGYCFVQTTPYGKFPVALAFPENRLWQQLQIKSQLGKVEFINRIRVEQRFSKLPVYNLALTKYELGSTIFTNRARFLVRASLPLNNKTIVDKTFYVTAFNEAFINYGKNVKQNLLDQNRTYIGLGYKLPIGRLELGFVEQTLVKPDGLKIEDNHTFQFSLNSGVDFFKKKK